MRTLRLHETERFSTHSKIDPGIVRVACGASGCLLYDNHYSDISPNTCDALFQPWPEYLSTGSVFLLHLKMMFQLSSGIVQASFAPKAENPNLLLLGKGLSPTSSVVTFPVPIEPIYMQG